MTNGTTPTENGSASDAALIAAITTDAITTIDTAAEPAAPVPEKAPSFDDLPLHADVKLALDDMGYFTPTPVQTAVFHPVTEGKDLLVQSRTGTGKTAAFGLPLINRIVPAVRQPQAMILCPTRELALQVARELTQLGKHRGVIIEAVYGGAPIGKQINALRDGVHIIVGTPGRVLDHIGRRTLDCKTISTFVLDECDEMLSMGFLEDIERVTSNLPEKHQTLLFSATMPVEVERYAKRHMKNAENLSLSRDSTTVTDIHHAYYIVSGIARSRDLLKILFAENPDSAIIFCNMRDETTMVAKFLTKQGLDAEPLSSDLSQADRERVMARMKAKNLRFLCATDVAARGIDISNLSHVINFSVPESPEVYVHRTGRTGRAGKKGVALSLVGPRELGNFRFIRLQFGIKPEERVLPKDDIFVGTPAASLPPIGRQIPPDPVDLLIRAVPQTPGDLEIGILEKLLKKASGKRVLAQLVAEKLNTLSLRSSSPRREERPPSDERRFDGGERPERPGGGRFDRDRGPRGGSGGGDRDRPRFDRDRGPGPGPGGPGDQVVAEGHERPAGRDDRPRFDRDRPRFDRDRGGPGADGGRGPGSSEGGEFVSPGGPGGVIPEGEQRPREDRPRFDRDRGGDRGDRPRFDRGDRGPREDRGPRDDRPRFNADGTPAVNGTNGTNGESRGDRGDRPRFDRGDRPRFDRDRGPRDRDNRNENRNDTIPVVDTTATEVTPELAPVSTEAAAPVEQRNDRDRERDRDRGDRGGRDRDRGGRDRDRGERRFDRDRNDRPAPVPAAPAEQRDSHPEMAASPALAETLTDTTDTTATKVDDVAKAALERAPRTDKSSRDKKRSEPTEATREFWETWADNKSTKPEVAAKPVAVAPEATEEVAAADDDAGEERKGRSRGGRGRGRGGAKAKADEKPATKASAAKEAAKESKDSKADAKKDEAPSRGKRDTVVTPAGDGTQARLFVSLGKKHGVSADDLRSLLAGPIGGDTARIGSVSLRDSHAHVRVPEELVDAIISGVHGTQHKEQDVTVERSRA